MLNLKRKYENKGITLIALVITIIVLLILAGISISMLAGQNSILSRAGEAKSNTERKTVIESAQIDIVGQQAENKSNEIEKNQLQSILNKYFQNVPNMSEMDREEIVSKELNTLPKYGDYTIEVSEIFNGYFKGETEKLKLAEQITSNNYGNSTDYTVTVGGVELSSWKIFYKDNSNNVFLIYSDYLPSEALNSIKDNLHGTISKKSLYWESFNYNTWNYDWSLQACNQNGLFKATGYTLNANYPASKCASTLLNTDNWTAFVNTNQGATYAIGSPTLEMWTDSWNERNPSQKLYYNTNEYGYYVGTNSSTTDTRIELENITNQELYCINRDDENDVYAYMLASPNADENSTTILNAVFYDDGGEEMIIGYYYDDVATLFTGNGIRPIIALSPNTFGTYTNGTWVLETN